MIDACEAVLQRVPVIIVQVFHQPVYFPRQEQMEIILIYLYHITSIWHFNIYIAKVHYAENSTEPFAGYLGRHCLARVRVTQFFPTKNLSTRHY